MPVEHDPFSWLVGMMAKRRTKISYSTIVYCLKSYVCATVLWHHGCMSNEHSPTLRCASPEYREMATKLRELARTSIFPGSRRSLLRLAVSFDDRAAHFDCQAAREGAPWMLRNASLTLGWRRKTWRDERA